MRSGTCPSGRRPRSSGCCRTGRSTGPAATRRSRWTCASSARPTPHAFGRDEEAASLERAVDEGTFRRDLFYRISTLVIEVPPLRERPTDIPLLALHFLHSVTRRQKLPALALSDATLRLLSQHSWPGNVRELEHVIERAVLMCDGRTVEPEHLPLAVTHAATGKARPPSSAKLLEAVEELERTMIVEALERSGWVKTRAAELLGITPRIIGYKILNLGIREPQRP